jgi:hypothetical protein
VRPESTWTTPRPDCPNPERWHAPDDESTEAEVTELVAAFVRAIQPDLAVETGTAYGYTAAAIGEALSRNGHGRLDTLELDPRRAAAARARCAGLPVTVLEGSSLGYRPDIPVGFAWLDSLLGTRAAELAMLRPYLATGAIVGIHDAGPFHEHRETFERAFKREGLRPIYLRTPRGVLFAEVL